MCISYRHKEEKKATEAAVLKKKSKLVKTWVVNL